MIYDKRDLILEYVRRQHMSKFNIRKLCFKEQKLFILDKERFKAAFCSRRSGKTHGCAMDLIKTSLDFPGATCLYITLSRISAKKIIWRQLLEINEEYRLGGIPKLGDLSMTFTNGSVIYLSGAKDSNDIERFRGMKLNKVYIDEAQAFKKYLRDLIEDILEPCLWDYQGSMILIGTPNAACKGVFFEACHNMGIFKNWSVHHWSILNNTKLPFLTRTNTIEAFLEKELKRKNIDKSDPVWQRETLGNWVRSTDSLVFQFDDDINTYSGTPPVCEDYILGADIGFNDKDSIVILGWSQGKIYVVDEWHQGGCTITEFTRELKRLDEKWRPIKKVIDAGALGKKIVEEIRVRHGLNLIAAEKQRKYEFIALVNSDLKMGTIKVDQGGELIQELQLLQYDEKGKIDERFSDDLVDAFLYSYREARHFGYVAPVEKVIIGSKEWARQEEDRIEQELEKQFSNNNDEDW